MGKVVGFLETLPSETRQLVVGVENCQLEGQVALVIAMVLVVGQIAASSVVEEPAEVFEAMVASGSFGHSATADPLCGHSDR
jgi:hypothetical protein